MRFFVLPLLITLVACNGLEKSEKEKVRSANAVKESIYRLSHEHVTSTIKWDKCVRERYAWEKTIVGNFPSVTKEFFRCKGSYGHPTLGEGNSARHDCGGIDQHSLPTVNGEETVHKALIDLLNYVQGELKGRVVVTCGHRCPKHNQYIDPTSKSRHSKHMMGAEVDFYVEGYQDKPYDVVKCLMQYYSQHQEFKDIIPFTRFSKAKSGTTSYKHPLWINREVAIRILDVDEGRDLDNSHSYPYICIELKWDRVTKKRLHFNYLEAHQSLLTK